MADGGGSAGFVALAASGRELRAGGTAHAVGAIGGFGKEASHGNYEVGILSFDLSLDGLARGMGALAVFFEKSALIPGKILSFFFSCAVAGVRRGHGP